MGFNSAFKGLKITKMHPKTKVVLNVGQSANCDGAQK